MKKLNRLALPDDMKGMKFLDIGCNEGFFCNAAAERGAEALGIDYDHNAIEFAKQQYPRPSVEFLRQDWSTLPAGPFDVVLWASAMHYERDPAQVVANVKKILKPGGLFILECGVVWDIDKEYVTVRRPSDVTWYPTQRLLYDEILRGFTCRVVAHPDLAEWDTIPRLVFHCRPVVTTVLLVRGVSGRGKSTLARSLATSATKLISLDRFLQRLVSRENASDTVNVLPVDQLVEALAQRYDRDNLSSLYEYIDQASLTELYVDTLLKTISPSDAMVVIDGLMTDQQARYLTQRLSGAAVVWDVLRRSFNQ